MLVHKRIRLFNTRITYSEQKLDNDLSHAVVARGTLVFLRGQCPQDFDTLVSVASGDSVQHTQKVMQNIVQLLKESGSQMAHVTKLGVY
jgi:enamine deaminase RidA (YjgF/YER057c/UK114 family)